MHTIGVFDSGKGGESVAKAIALARPNDKIIFVNDSKNLPYGTKSPEQLHGFVLPILQKLSKQCDVIVIACNTVSTVLIEVLRNEISCPLIALEPMVKPAAAQTKTNTIAVCATPTTLASKRYHFLKRTYATEINVLEPDCGNWAYMIEHEQVDEAIVRKQIEAVCNEGADIVVLACTHYHWIEELIKKITAGRAKVIQPEQAIILQLNRVLEQLR